MPEQESLLHAVLERPDDDAPRLAYAAWCEGQGDEPTRARAEFIRRQIELARPDPESPLGQSKLPSYHRSQELLGLYSAQWAGPIAELTSFYSFRRGFIELIRITARGFLDHAAQLFAAAPIRHMDLTGVRDVTEELFASPYLGRLRSLSMDGCGLRDIHLHMLASAPQVTRLRWLSVADNRLSLAAAEALAASPSMKELRFAEFRGNPSDPAEQLGIDSGVVVSVWFPPDGVELERRFGPLPWLHREGETSRFSV